MCALETAD